MAAGSSNYYDVLGIPRDADAKAIRAAYRKLARKYHPDVNPGRPEAAEHFKRISEAYDVLGDPEKRKLYDRFGDQWEVAQRAKEQGIDVENMGFDPRAGYGFGDAGTREFRYTTRGFEDLGGFEFGDLSDLLGSVLGSRGASGFGAARTRGADIESEVTLDLSDVLRGALRPVSIAHEEDCPDCGGKGRARSGRCSRCAGRGRVERQRRIEVKIPPGVREGSRIRVQGEGGAGRQGGRGGDLYLRVRIKPHPFFQRVGNDLHCELPVTFPEAALGAEIEVPTLTGRVKVKVPPGTSSGQSLRLRGMGLPDPKTGQRGDLLVKIMVATPRTLSYEDQQQIRQLERLYRQSPRAGLWHPQTHER